MSGVGVACDADAADVCLLRFVGPLSIVLVLRFNGGPSFFFLYVRRIYAEEGRKRVIYVCGFIIYLPCILDYSANFDAFLW